MVGKLALFLNIVLDAEIPIVDGDTRIAIEKAKRAASIDRSSTCFKGKGSLPKTSAAKCMWLAQEKKEEEYI